MIRTGIDITDISRISKIQEKNPKFAKKVLTENELNYYNKLSFKQKNAFLAGRFSAKESFSKALGTGIGKNFSFKDIEILNDELGKPIIKQSRFLYNTSISISHTENLVITNVILEKVKKVSNMVVGRHRNTAAVIDLKAVKYNVKQEIKRMNPNQKLFAVVKANAYGHGLLEVAHAAKNAGAKGFCVAVIDEGVALRKDGLKDDILILGLNPANQAVYIAENNLTATVGTIDFLYEVQPLLKKANQKLKLHFAFDTGMGRIGFLDANDIKKAEQFIAENSEQFELEGVFTHFASADEKNDIYYQKQLKKFKELLGALKNKPKYIHVANSASAMWHKDCGGNIIRYGISMYGLNPSGNVLKDTVNLKPALSLYSELVNVKQIKSGDSISYGSTYTAKESEWIGTLPIGYADGWLRRMQGFKVLVDGNYCEIVGRVCMDQMMIRLPKKIAVGTKAILIGKSKDKEISALDVASYAGTIHYEVTSCLGQRIQRKYLN